jgi:DNA-binding transcriptional ArsR family regulator
VNAERLGRQTVAMAADQLARIAALLGDETRAEVCVTLLDGRSWTAGELARATEVAPSTMSAHLGRLVDGGLLVERRQGRHRYVELAGRDVAEVLEHLLTLTEPRPPTARTLRAVSASEALARGRTCYDHLAGRLGVAVTDALRARGVLGDDLALTAAGHEWFTGELDADFTASRRPVSRSCVDWTERRPHLAGQAGAHLCTQFLDRGWVRRIGTGRAVRTTPAGDEAMRDVLALDTTAL